MTAGAFVPDRAEPIVDMGERAAFWACVGLVLVFSQCWIMPLIGPGPDPVDPAVSASIRNYYFPVYLVVIVLAGMSFQRVALALLRSPLLVLMMAMPFVSLLWTIDPEVTARRAVAVSFTMLAGAVIAARFSWPKFLEVFAAAFGVMVVLSFLVAIAAPSYGKMIYDFPGAWRGVWGHKNLLGYFMSIGFVVFPAAAIANPRRRWVWIAAAGGALLLMLLSTSKTALVSCLVGGSFIPLVALARRGAAGAILATYLLVFAVVGLSFLLYAQPDVLLGLIGKDATLTGRTRIWSAVLHQIAARPMTGYGYGAVWDNISPWAPLMRISKEQGFIIHEAHNTWLALWLELGYFGLASWGLLFAGVWGRAMLTFYNSDRAYVVLPFLVVFSLHTFTETAALAPNDLVWLIFCALAVKLAAPDDSMDGQARHAASESSRVPEMRSTIPQAFASSASMK